MLRDDRGLPMERRTSENTGMSVVFIVALVVGFVPVCVTLSASAQQDYELGEQGFEAVAAPEPGTPEAGIYEIRKAIAEDRPKDAVKLAEMWIKQHPNHPLLAEAHLLRGDAFVESEELYKALFEYEFVSRGYPGTEQFKIAQEREFKVAQAFASGTKRKLWGMRIITAYSEAEELLIRIQERAPGSKLAERAGLELADFYYNRSDMASAAEAYDLFLENYPNSQWNEHAMQRQVLANLATFKGPRFDATGLIEAQNRLREYRRTFPAASERMGADALLTRIDETLATRSYLVAEWYESRGKRVEAVFMYKRVLSDHSGSAAARRALDRLAVLAPHEFSSTAPASESAAATRATRATDASPAGEGE